MRQAEKDRAEAVETLSKMLKPGDTVFTVLRSVSRSGMSREIGLLVPTNGNGDRPGFFHPNYSASVLTGNRQNKAGDGVKVSGCGMDMGFHLVYAISRRLWPNGFKCIGEGCPSNDHSNHADRENTQHSDGGYALRHEWV